MTQDNIRFRQSFSEYQQECSREISDLIEKNPIKFEDIRVGDILKLYSPLHGVSKVNRDGEHKIRELFAPCAGYVSSNMWALASKNFFRVWDLREEIIFDKVSGHLVRIDEPSLPFDWNPHWVDIRYFSTTVR